VRAGPPIPRVRRRRTRPGSCSSTRRSRRTSGRRTRCSRCWCRCRRSLTAPPRRSRCSTSTPRSRRAPGRDDRAPQRLPQRVLLSAAPGQAAGLWPAACAVKGQRSACSHRAQGPEALALGRVTVPQAATVADAPGAARHAARVYGPGCTRLLTDSCDHATACFGIVTRTISYMSDTARRRLRDRARRR